MLKSKRLTAFFLACLMLLGTIFPAGKTLAQDEKELVKTKISMKIKDQKGNTIILNDKTKEVKNCRLEIDWDASEYKTEINEGDYFNITLPKNFEAAESNFAIRTPDGVQVANAHVNRLNSEERDTLNVVFTRLVEDKTDVKGSVSIRGNVLNTNTPIGDKESKIKENETSTKKTMNYKNNENKSTDGKCSNIELSLDIESPDKTEYYGTDLIQSKVVIDGKGLEDEVEGLYYDVIFPSEEFPISGDMNWDPIDVTSWEDPNNQGKYIDSSATIQNYPMIDKVEKRVEDGKTIYRVYLKAIDSTTTLKIPYTFSFKDNITPPDYKFQPEVKLYDANGCLVKEAKDKEYSIKYADFRGRKLVNLSSEKDQMNYGGSEDKNDHRRISENDTRPVNFQFQLEAINRGYNGANARALKSYVVTDTLPTYTDKDGKERTAEFRAEENPGWVLSKDGKTVTYNLNERKRQSTKDGDFLCGGAEGDLYEEGVQLKLRFPGAETNSKDTPKEDRVYYDNSVDIEARPYNPSKGEVYKASANLSFQLTSDPLDGSGVFWKNNEYDNGVSHPETSAKTYYDPTGMASAEVNYSVYLQNRTPNPMKDIVITEDAKNFDPRLYVSGIISPQQTTPNKKYVDSSQYEIRGIKSDGTYDIITEKLFNYTEHPINKLAQEEAKNIRRQVLDGKIDRENAPAVNPEYDKVEIHFNNFELPVGAQLKLGLKMKYKDPFKVKFEPDRALNNTAEVMFKSGDDKYAFTASADKYLIPIEESVKLDKRTDYKGNSTPKVGDKVRFDINYDFKGLSGQRELSNLTFVDLLPEGITVNTDPKELGLEISNRKQLNYKYELVKNYNNTGRDALILKFDNFLVGDYETANGKILRIRFDGKINENIVPEKAITDKINNDNIVYSYFNDDQSVLNPKVGDPLSSTVVVDKLDINNNGKTHDSILMAKSDVKSILAQSVKSIKRIRSVEPVEENGDLVYDRAFSLDTVTNYADKANDKLGRFEYQLRVNNYIEEPLKNLEIYDILPSFVDGNNKYRNKLVDEIKIYKAGKDVTSDFTVFYTTDGNPSDDPVKAVKNQNWVKNPTSYEDVTAIKIKSNINPVLENYETLDIRLQMKAPEYPGNNNLNDKVATNSFFVRYAEDGNFGESNSVTNGLIRRKNVSVEKNWEDDNNKDGKRPDKATVKLLANGADTGKELVLTKDNNWKGTFTNLDEYKDKEKIAYTVKEIDEKDGSITIGDNKYQVSYGGTEEDGFTITNKLEEKSSPWTPITPSKTDIKVEKAWEDKDGKEIAAPVEKIEVELYREGKATGKKLELNKANKWRGEFKDLDVVEKVDSEKAYEYTVKEVGEENGKVVIGNNKYEVKYSGSMKDGFTITNKEEPIIPPTPITPSKTDIKVEKAWEDKDGKEIAAPVEKIEVELYRDGKATGKKLELNKANKWSGEFKDLDVLEKVDSEKAYEYTVKEVGEEKGKAVIGNNKYEVKYSGSMKDGFTITNKEEPIIPPTPITPSKTDIKVEKAWEDKDGKEIAAPVEKIEVELYRDGKATGKKLELNKANKWSGEFKDLDVLEKVDSEKAYEYTVKEVGEEKGKAVIGNNKYEVKYSGSMKDGFTITNKEEPIIPPTPITPSKTDIKVEKAWEDKDGKEIAAPVEKIEVELYRDGKATGKKLELNKANKWSGEFKDLDVLEKVDSEKAYEYTVKEVGEEKGKAVIGNNKYEVKYSGSMKDGFTITNKEEPIIPPTPITPSKTDIKVEKAWEDKDGKEIAAPVEKIEVELYRDGKATGKKLELNKANKWSGEFKDLDVLEKVDSEKAYEYTVKEVGEEKGKAVIGNNKYEVKYSGSMKDGFTITNKEEPIIPPTPITPSKTDIKVEKAWEDKDGKEIAAPVEKIEVELYRDGKATGKKLELNKANKWSGEFKDLDVLEKVDSEKAYEYTVKEVGEENGKIAIGTNKYQVSYEGNAKDGLKVINKEEPETPDKPKDPDKPWTPLTPSKEDIKVEKIWQDKDGKVIDAPEDKIEVELYRDGKSTGKKLELNKANKWRGEFKDLDVVEKVDSEKSYEYTVKEVGEENGKIAIGTNKYQVSYEGNAKDGLKVINKEEPETPDKPKDPDKPWTPLTPSKTDIKVEKAWKDKDGKEIAAPVEKIEVELYRDGKATGKKLELNKANKWSGEFKDLDVLEKVDSEKAYEYTVKEVGEEKGKVVIGNNKYEVKYSGSMKDGFTITNKEEPIIPPTPITPSKQQARKLPKSGSTMELFTLSVAGLISATGAFLESRKKKKR